MNNIINNFDRLDNEIIEKFKNLSTPDLSDVMDRYYCMDHSIKPVYRNAKVVGTAFTVKTYPSDNLMCHIAIKLAKPGDILVIDAGGFPNAGLWGELMSLAAKIKGLGGVVIDGGVRDRFEIEEIDFPVFSKSINSRGGFKKNLGSINHTIACGGVAVNAGDIVVGDENGVVIVPKDIALEVCEKATNKMANEVKIKKQMEKGIELYDLLNLGEVVKKYDLEL